MFRGYRPYLYYVYTIPAAVTLIPGTWYFLLVPGILTIHLSPGTWYDKLVHGVPERGYRRIPGAWYLVTLEITHTLQHY